MSRDIIKVIKGAINTKYGIMVMGRWVRNTERTPSGPGVGRVKGSQPLLPLCSYFTYVLFCMHGCYIIKIVIFDKYMEDKIC